MLVHSVTRAMSSVMNRKCYKYMQLFTCFEVMRRNFVWGLHLIAVVTSHFLLFDVIKRWKCRVCWNVWYYRCTSHIIGRYVAPIVSRRMYFLTVLVFYPTCCVPITWLIIILIKSQICNYISRSHGRVESGDFHHITHSLQLSPPLSSLITQFQAWVWY